MTEKELNRRVGKNIKKFRILYNVEKGKLTQKELADKIGVSVSLIGALESNKITQGISIHNLYKISNILNVNINKFFE